MEMLYDFVCKVKMRITKKDVEDLKPIEEPRRLGITPTLTKSGKQDLFLDHISQSL